MTLLRDPRLTNPLVLLMAGQRLLHRQAQPPPPSWQEMEGLSGLLDYAKRLGPQPVPEVDEHSTGLGALLWQARQQVEEHHRDVQQNCSLESDIKRNQCQGCRLCDGMLVVSECRYLHHVRGLRMSQRPGKNNGMSGGNEYPGGKGGAGVYQAIINQMPWHETYIKPFLGGGAIMALKRPARWNIGIDLDAEAVRQARARIARDDDAGSCHVSFGEGAGGIVDSGEGGSPLVGFGDAAG